MRLEGPAQQGICREPGDDLLGGCDRHFRAGRQLPPEHANLLRMPCSIRAGPLARHIAQDETESLVRQWQDQFIEAATPSKAIGQGKGTTSKDSEAERVHPGLDRIGGKLIGRIPVHGPALEGAGARRDGWHGTGRIRLRQDRDLLAGRYRHGCGICPGRCARIRFQGREGLFPAFHRGIENHAHILEFVAGLLRDLVFQAAHEQADIPVRTVVTPAQLQEHVVEPVCAIQAIPLPEHLGGTLQGTHAGHLAPAEPGLEGLGDPRQQGVNGIFHLRDAAVADVVAGAAQFGREPAQRDRLSEFLAKQGLGLDHGTRPVDQAQAPAKVVFPEVRQQDVGLPGPRPVQAVHPAEPFLAGPVAELPENVQPGIAPGTYHVLGFVRPARDDQGLLQPAFADRCLDALVFRVFTAARVALVGLDAGDIQAQMRLFLQVRHVW